MVWIETKLPLEREEGEKEKRSKLRRSKKRTSSLSVMFSFYLEKNLKYAKMLTFVNSRGEWQGFCFYCFLKYSIFKHFFELKNKKAKNKCGLWSQRSGCGPSTIIIC